jgi:hypothetical protein
VSEQQLDDLPDEQIDPQQLLRIDQLADRLNLSFDEAEALVNTGQIHHYMLPMGKVRFYWPAVLADLEQFYRRCNPEREFDYIRPEPQPEPVEQPDPALP